MKGRPTNYDKYTPDPNTGCWLWTGAAMPSGYGQLIHNNRKLLAHRAMWERHNGPIPPGKNVCHRCDNPRCVNPEHLFIGSQAENLIDMRAKGRGSKPPRNDHRGERHPSVKLTEQQAREIRATTGMRKDIAARFNISPTQVHRIQTGKRWAHLS